jgi:hypothetical protein
VDRVGGGGTKEALSLEENAVGGGEWLWEGAFHIFTKEV